MIEPFLTSLRTKRIELGITTRDLGERLGVAYSVIPKWERRLVEIPLWRVWPWAEALGCTVHIELVDEQHEAISLSPVHRDTAAAFQAALPVMSEAEAATYRQVFDAIAARPTILAASPTPPFSRR